MTHPLNRSHIEPNLVTGSEGVPWNRNREQYIKNQYNMILDDLKERLEQEREIETARLDHVDVSLYFKGKQAGIDVAIKLLEEYL